MGSTKLRFDELTLEGVSRAGDETWFRVHPPGLALDVGRGAPELTGARDIFLSHGHLDHVSGLPWLLSQRALLGLPGPRVFCPEATAGPLAAWLLATERVDRGRYGHEILGLGPGDRVDVGRDLTVEAFATDHGVPSLGYHLVRHDSRLRPELQGLGPDEILQKKKSGEGIEEAFETLWLSYCGDSGEAVFDLEPRLFESRILLIECTFLEDDDLDRARRYRHLHLEDLVCRKAEFRNEHLVLHHLSRRHREKDLARAARRRLKGLAPEVVVFTESE
jgi:ribonuclease Z